MNLQTIKLLHAYNCWATNRIFDAVEALPAEEMGRDMKCSHGSIHGTLTHMAGAERMWLSRMSGTPDSVMIAPADVPTIGDLKRFWETTGFGMARFLGTMTDRKLQEAFTMSTTSGQQYAPIYWQAIQHVVDHSTYHRGQVVTLIRQLGHKSPPTGMIMFYKETGKHS